MYLADIYEEYLQQKESFLDQFIADGSEQELFASSYIHGHLSLVASKVFSSRGERVTQQDFDHHTLQFQLQMRQSIDDAIASKEVQGQDAEDVKVMLERLFTA